MFEFITVLSQIHLLAAHAAQIWYSIPLIVVISLVWGATRHEHLKEIVIHSVRSLFWVLTFMGIIFAVIFVAGYFQ